MFEALIVSLKLAFLTTIILMLLSLIISPLISFKEFRGKGFLLSLFTLPLVLPPTVLGFYLILLLSPESLLGRLAKKLFGTSLLFTFEGILLASLVYSFPLAVLPVINVMEKVKKEYMETAYIFGYSPIETYVKVVLPLSLEGIITACILVFVHTLGEFGVILMVGGNIPGETQTLSIYVYDSVQALDYRSAHIASLILLSIALISTILVYLFGKRKGLKY
ncbi:molybdate ABC transporter permease subunit [Aquifex pyrophilus]|uniref:Molybdenum transport system permease n=1 Tax=Aquifex pyrophilus TaxID=2714 RepID=Q8GLK6_AQUPY|nr:molybdenum transport system permease [Aquifex pyrophilus]